MTLANQEKNRKTQHLLLNEYEFGHVASRNDLEFNLNNLLDDNTDYDDVECFEDEKNEEILSQNSNVDEFYDAICMYNI
jgi:hypothetical protein